MYIIYLSLGVVIMAQNIKEFAEELKEVIQNGASTSDVIQILQNWYDEKQQEEDCYDYELGEELKF
jgi:hypothetical protein